MPYKTIDEFIKRLEEQGELIRINEPVSPFLEIAEINDRLVKNNGKAVLFENTGTGFPVLVNSMGSEKRIAMALNVEKLDDLGKRIKTLFDMLSEPKDNLLQKLRMLPKLGEVASWAPVKIKGKGLCQQNEISGADITKLPVLTTWPHDGGPFITLPVVHTVSPSSGIPNTGMYRMQVYDKNKTGMHWHIHKDGASHFREYKERGEKMPVTVTIGGDPAYIYAATAPLPENIDEYMLAGFLRRKKVRLVKCLTNDIYVPEDVDFVIEGYVDPNEEFVVEGPFGDHTGYYSLEDKYPVFHITKITHRNGAVYPATVVGIPPQEDAWIGLATERIFLNPIKMTMVPEIADMHMPPEGVFHNIVLASIHKSYPGQAAKVCSALWGAGQMMFNKFLFILDNDIKLTDYNAVSEAVLKNVDPVEDVFFYRGPMDVLDHASSDFAYGGKAGFDATIKRNRQIIAPEFNKDKCDSVAGIVEANDSFVKLSLPLLIVKVKKSVDATTRKIARQLIEFKAIENVSFVVFIEEVADINSIGDVVWRVANNTDPVRDCFYAANDRDEKHPVLFIDGTRKTLDIDGFKRPWPNIVVMNDETIQLVDKKWKAYGIGEFLESPSLKYSKQLYNGDAVAEE